MIKKFFSSELGRGMIVLFILMNLSNFLGFLFHFSMARLLEPADYGTLAVLMSIIYVFGVPAEAIQTLSAKYTSELNIKKKYGEIKFFMFKSLKRGFYVALILFLIGLPISFFLADFLGINFWLIVLTNTTIFYAILTPITRGVLQGRKKFELLGVDLIIESIVKLSIAALLVFVGFKLFGAMLGVILGVLMGLIFTFLFNKEILHSKEEKINFTEIYKDFIPYLVAMTVIYLMLSLDIILAKRFFSPEIAGQYSVLSMLGKMIFFGSISISKAMFPLSSERHESNQNTSKIFYKSLIITGSICLISVLACWLFPELIIGLLYGNKYLEIAPYLVYSAIALSFLSLGNLVLMYSLSINKLKRGYYLAIFLILEIILLYMFHDNISQYILAFMVSNIVMFLFSFFFIKR